MWEGVLQKENGMPIGVGEIDGCTLVQEVSRSKDSAVQKEIPIEHLVMLA